MPQPPLAGDMIFLLFLLIPGYVSLRSYLWANVAVDTTSRLSKLVILAIGGFLSISTLFLLHAIVPSFVPSLNFTSFPTEFALIEMSNLSVLQATNLLILQTMVGWIGGIIVGAGRYIFIDSDNPLRKDLNDPWEELYNHVSTGDKLTVITHNGDKINGRLEQKGNPSDEHNLLLSEPSIEDSSNEKEESTSSSTDPVQLSYHDPEGIARIEAYEEPTSTDRGLINSKYMFALQKLCDYKGEPGQFSTDVKKRWKSYREENEADEEIDVTLDEEEGDQEN